MRSETNANRPMRLREADDALRLSVRTIRAWIAKKKFRAYSAGWRDPNLALRHSRTLRSSTVPAGVPGDSENGTWTALGQSVPCSGVCQNRASGVCTDTSDTLFGHPCYANARVNALYGRTCRMCQPKAGGPKTARDETTASACSVNR
jgi:hypothetical protein